MRVVQPKKVPFSSVSHTRASTGTYIRSNRNFEEAGVNELRRTFDRDTLRFDGFLIEPRRTNLFINTLSGKSGRTLYPSNLSTQTVNTSGYIAMCVSFYGTGSITITSNNYSFILQGTGTNQRVFHTINRARNTNFTFSVSGQVYAANCEGLTIADVDAPTTFDDSEYDYVRPTSWIPTQSTPATRSADILDGYGVLYTDFADPNPPYNPSTTYQTDDRVLYENSVYQSLVDNNTGNTPDTSESQWAFVKTSNKYAMFDLEVGYQSTAINGDFGVSSEAGAMVAIRMPKGLVTSATFLEMSAQSTLEEGTLQDEVLDRVALEFVTYDSQRKGGPDYFKGFTGSTDSSGLYSGNSRYGHYDGFNSDIISFRLASPEQFDGSFYNTVDPNTQLSIGEVVLGLSKEIGKTQYGIRAGIIDYSIKDTDQFGYTRFVKRGYSKRMSGSVYLENDEINDVLKTLYELRATPTVFVGSDESEYDEVGIIFGYYRDMSLVIPYPSYALYDIEVEGLAI